MFSITVRVSAGNVLDLVGINKCSATGNSGTMNSAIPLILTHLRQSP
jgi:hypothetical protein